MYILLYYTILEMNMNKYKVMKYYLNTWVPFMEQAFDVKTYTIIYKNNKIKISTDSSLFHWGYTIIPISKDNILSSSITLLVWIRGEDIKLWTSENPIGLKKIMNKATWLDVYRFLRYIKKSIKSRL